MYKRGGKSSAVRESSDQPRQLSSIDVLWPVAVELGRGHKWSTTKERTRKREEKWGGRKKVTKVTTGGGVVIKWETSFDPAAHF